MPRGTTNTVTRAQQFSASSHTLCSTVEAAMTKCRYEILAALVAVFAIGTAGAQPYPVKPIRMVVAWPAGGGTDVIARIVSQRLSDSLKQQVVVDNRGGASTIIGTENIAKSAPDGYTMGFATSNLAVNPALYANLPYDALRDLLPVTLAARGLYVIIVHPSVPAKNVNELVALIKTAPDKFNVSLAGPGTPNHLALAQLNAMLGVKLAGIHYKGAAPAVAAVAGGETQLMFISYPTVVPHVQAGRLRIIAVTSAQRSAAAPDIPTAVESGLPGFVVEEWYGIVAPAKTEKVHIDRINDEVRKLLTQTDVKEKLVGLGADIVGSSPDEFLAFVRSEMTKWAKIVKDAGIKAE
jgi:tripartite-type tricarboxylate transporter receptor subunit TctC